MPPDEADHRRQWVAGTLFAGLAVGDRIRTGGFAVTPDLSLEFARLYDPQPMHLDDAAGRDSVFGELVSSGWQTMAITMRLVVDARLFGDAPLIGLGLDQARFLRPVKPGDELRVEAEILSMTPSRIRPDRGTAQVKVVTLNQKDMPVLEQQWTMLLLAGG
jgi:acyl dehydratase